MFKRISVSRQVYQGPFFGSRVLMLRMCCLSVHRPHNRTERRTGNTIGNFTLSHLTSDPSHHPREQIRARKGVNKMLQEMWQEAAASQVMDQAWLEIFYRSHWVGSSIFMNLPSSLSGSVVVLFYLRRRPKAKPLLFIPQAQSSEDIVDLVLSPIIFKPQLTSHSKWKTRQGVSFCF